MAMITSAITLLALFLSVKNASAKGGVKRTSLEGPSGSPKVICENDHPDDCALLQDIHDEARSSAERGKRFMTTGRRGSMIAFAPMRG